MTRESGRMAGAGQQVAEAEGVWTADRFPLSGGGSLAPLALAWRSWGCLSAAKDNVVLLFHPFGNDRHAAGLRPNGKPGWWAKLIGPGLAVDTRRWFVVCAEVPGGLNAAGKRVEDLPAIAVKDWAAAHKRLLASLGVRQVALAVGGSMGGVQALQWLASGKMRTRRALVVAASPRLGGHGQAFCSFMRTLLGAGPRGIDLAGRYGLIAYHSESKLLADAQALGGMTALLDKAGKGMAKADAKGLLRLIAALEGFDLGRGRALARSFGGFKGRVALVHYKSDRLFPLQYGAELAEAFRLAGAAVKSYVEPGEDGHDTFLTRPLTLAPVINSLLHARV
jgi:homoserine O-acetyltransferase